MSLRIGWATPWNMRSAIAQSGASVAAELAGRGHVVDVIRTETGEYLGLEPRPAPGTIRRLCDADPCTLRREYDVIIVNLGDQYGHHGAAMHALPHLGAVAILHDRFYANLMQGALVAPDMCPQLRKAVRLVYGDAAISDDQPFWLPLEQMVTERSMLEWFAGLAIGAVVHAEHYADAVRSVCPGPVVTIPLAYPDPNFLTPRPIDNEMTIVTVGHVNQNKCVDRVIMAIASSKELRLHCRYRLVGPFEESERDRLLGLARRVGVTGPDFTGWVSDSDLHSEILGADVICCLRNPVLEGGSASAIFGMLSGRPLLVSNHGVYAEMPDDLVFKCQPGEETTEVARHLTSILRDPAAAQARGSRARQYASRHHSASRYVDALLPLLQSAITVGPAITTGIAIGRILGSLGLKPDDPAAIRAVAPLASCLDDSRSKGGYDDFTRCR